MKIHHIAIWTFHLEKLREFYTRYFNGTSNEKYINSQKGFESYFISFESGATLELMSRIDVQNIPIEENRPGLTHLAFSFESQEAVLSLTEQLRTKGYHIVGAVFGIGIPLNDRRSFVNVSLEYDRLIPKEGMIKENALKLTFGLTFNESWFKKLKLN